MDDVRARSPRWNFESPRCLDSSNCCLPVRTPHRHQRYLSQQDQQQHAGGQLKAPRRPPGPIGIARAKGQQERGRRVDRRQRPEGLSSPEPVPVPCRHGQDERQAANQEERKRDGPLLKVWCPQAQRQQPQRRRAAGDQEGARDLWTPSGKVARLDA